MRLRFLGTRANVDMRTWRHRRHSALLVATPGGRLMIDCGSDWRGLLGKIAPDAILITHAHADHAWGLADGAPCPVYATEAAWQGLVGFDIADPCIVMPRRPIAVAGMVVEGFVLVHSIRAPAVGYRVAGGRSVFFYAPDVVDIPERKAALQGVSLYIGDGSTMRDSLVRRRGDSLFGHTTIRAQIGWCAEQKVPRAVFTHCGGPLIKADREARRTVRALGEARGVDSALAYDGLRLKLS